jgi:long-chain acyl-CoA synthetase
MHGPIYTAPPGTGTSTLGKTLPDLLYDALDKGDVAKFMNQPLPGGGWLHYSISDFRDASEEIALGLNARGVARGERAAFFMRSDLYFALADMGCLIAGVIDVPIYLTHGGDAIQFVLEHSESRVLFVSDAEGLAEVLPLLPQTQIELLVVADETADLSGVPDGVEALSLEALRGAGRASRASGGGSVEALLEQVGPDDLATIIYTSGTTGTPKGVMLTHQNISSNGLAAISGLGWSAGEREDVAIAFLPMTHIFQRTMHYCYVAYGLETYFCEPEQVGEIMREVRPTTFATVPRVLEKVYTRILEKAESLSGAKRALFDWSMRLAKRYELGQQPTGLYAVQLAIANRLVFSKWREALGARVGHLIVGGAALSPELANVFAAAGVSLLQGYGLTETSPVITYNRPGRNRAGTVGEPLAGVEVTIADDGEILTRGPHVMTGYYKRPERTAEVLTGDGWFCTGDIGEFTDEGRLVITDRKKDLFKLSTGKYVTPSPLESVLTAQPLIEQAVVVGVGHKFTTALIFPDQAVLRVFADRFGRADAPLAELLADERVVGRYRELVQEANQGKEYWTQIKRFRFVTGGLSIEEGLLTPTLKVKRSAVRERFAADIEALYNDADPATLHVDDQAASAQLVAASA